MGRFEGRTVIVTGAASGIGRATSLRFASEGADVVAVDVNSDGLAELAQEGSGIRPTIGDIRSQERCREIVEEAVDHSGALHAVCNIAAINIVGRAVDLSEEQWHRMYDVNVGGTFFMCQASLPHLEETNGAIVNTASNAATQGLAYFVAYCATKGAVAQLTRALAMEYARTGVRINAVAPGGTDTPMNDAIFRDLPADADMELMMRASGWRPFSKPEELAGVIAWVASDEAKPLHGAIVAADQGLTAG